MPIEVYVPAPQGEGRVVFTQLAAGAAHSL